MNLLDKHIRVEMDDRGGIVFHIPAMNGNRSFFIINMTKKEGWGVQRSDHAYLMESGEWAPFGEACHNFKTPVDALRKAMGWGETVTAEQTLVDDCDIPDNG